MKSFLFLPQIGAYLLSEGAECDACITSGKQHCWNVRSDGSGSWSNSYCCGPGDSQCNNLPFCSNQVGDYSLKLFTCPVDTYHCPEKELVIYNNQASVSLDWDEFTFRQKAFCKYRIVYKGNYELSDLKSYAIKLNIDSNRASF